MKFKFRLKNKFFWIRNSCLLALVFLSACASKSAYVLKDAVFPQRVAVLPFSNQTNDVTAPEMVRKVMAELVALKGYEPIELKQVDEVLTSSFGITPGEGGQLRLATPQEFGRALKVDGLFYGNVEVFIDLPLGFVRKRTVKAEFQFVDSRSGTVLWREEKSWTTPELYVSMKEARWAAARQIGERQIERMRGTFLKEESEMMVFSALEQLPLAQGAVEAKNNEFLRRKNDLKDQVQKKIQQRIKVF